MRHPQQVGVVNVDPTKRLDCGRCHADMRKEVCDGLVVAQRAEDSTHSAYSYAGEEVAEIDPYDGVRLCMTIRESICTAAFLESMARRMRRHTHEYATHDRALNLGQIRQFGNTEPQLTRSRFERNHDPRQDLQFRKQGTKARMPIDSSSAPGGARSALVGFGR